MIEIYLVDDHPFVLEGLKTYLNTQQEIKVIGYANKGQQALTEIKNLEPTVAIIDLHLPDISGIKLIKKIQENKLNTKVIVLSSFCADDEVIAAIDAGALSYLMKDSPPQKLAKAIRAAENNEPVLHPRISKKLMQRVSNNQPVIEPLTPREKEVLAELTDGKSNKQIGNALFISTKTVKTHISNILRKLEVKDRTQAAIKAIKNNLIDR
ncbi:response regulator transcription factor [Halanaerocella petrolearia]